MKITIVYRYFWPDTPPYAYMLKEISGWLAEAGHEVTVLTAQPSYKPEFNNLKQPFKVEMNGFKVIRIPLLKERGGSFIKAVNSVLFPILASLLILFGRKQDFVWTATMPPVLQAFLVHLAGKLRGAEFIYHMQDIYPEIGILSGKIKNRLLANIMLWIDMLNLRAAKNAIVLNADMKSAVVSRGVPEHVPLVLPNFSIVSSSAKRHAEVPAKDDAVRFVFAGNIGQFQNLDALVDAFINLGDREIELHLVGDGKAKKGLMRKVAECRSENIRFYNHMPANDAFEFMCTCHVGVVSLQPGLYPYASPSKALTYAAANLPIFALMEAKSSLVQLLEEYKIGVGFSWDGNVYDLIESISEFSELVRGANLAPAAATEFYHAEFARLRWLELFRTYENDREAT